VRQVNVFLWNPNVSQIRDARRATTAKKTRVSVETYAS
jgi:hypothetical protein